MASVNLTAQKREDLSNTSTKGLRKNGYIPGVFYYKDAPSIAISVKATLLNPFVYTSEVRIIDLLIEGVDKMQKCILKDIQFDPVSDKPVHFDLWGISENEKIKVEVPLKMVGSPVGVRDGGVIQQNLYTIEIECFPGDIPSHIDVNIEHLAIGNSVHVNEIEAKNFEILDNPETTIVAVVPPAVEVVETPVEGEAVAEEGAEPEVIAKGKKEEEEPAEEKK